MWRGLNKVEDYFKCLTGFLVGEEKILASREMCGVINILYEECFLLFLGCHLSSFLLWLTIIWEVKQIVASSF